MYSRSAKYYDAVYKALHKDYRSEAARIRELAKARCAVPPSTLLDVACGTAQHLEAFSAWFDVEGIDLSPDMLKVASARMPNAPFHQADMRTFRLERRFDVVVCLYSGIAHMTTPGELDAAAANMAARVKPGGVLIVEPWFERGEWEGGLIVAAFVDEPQTKIARMGVTRREGNVSILEYHFMIAQGSGVETFSEPFLFTMFSEAEYKHAFEAAGLAVERIRTETGERGLYVCVKPR